MESNVNQIIGVSSKSLKKNQYKMSTVIRSKIISLQQIIKRTILSAQKYKTLDIFGANELNICVNCLEECFIRLEHLLSNKIYSLAETEQQDNHKLLSENDIIEEMQDITNELSSTFRTFGTDSIDDLLNVCFGADFVKNNFNTQDAILKYNIMKEHVHPIGYKIMSWKPDSQMKESTTPLRKNRIVEDFMIVETGTNLDSFDLARTSKSFQTKVYGIKFCIQHPDEKRTLIVCGIVDDVMLQCLDYQFITDKLDHFLLCKPSDPDFDNDSFKRFMKSLTLKELLVYNNEELYNRYMGYINQVNLIKQKTMSQVTKEFLANDLYGQRTTLIQLLLKSNEHEYQYLAYLLYDLLSNDINGNIDTQEQTLLYDSLPWDVKKYFRDAMRQTISYTNNLCNFDNTKIPLEQQICLMKANDTVKEKAMQKLKEVKSKADDSGSKARHYLEGLLRIPFGIYKEEPILRIMPECTNSFTDLVNTLTESNFPVTTFPCKSFYTSMEMRKYINLLKESQSTIIHDKLVDIIITGLTDVKRDVLVANICAINNINRKNNIKSKKLLHSGRKAGYMKTTITEYINSIKDNTDLLIDIGTKCGIYKDTQNIISLMAKGIENIETKSLQINEYMSNVTKTLDNAVHGHESAKRQIERIIGQWINGEKSGYCFGFEGPPGTGKTSIAKKGIANCLKDENGESRPFAFIAIGGSSNGSTLDGHNYTYVGATWGRIAEILMDKKCMNPIIFIDELDKISKTEHGREIIGILTHLIDSTQNDVFEDKYFSGIDLDLSKALFIFSYNDVDAIDKVLLDRIHRVKFKHLSLDEKLTVAKEFLLPEIFTKMGLNNMISISQDVIEYIIEEYTCEPGVRKLKELLFEIIGEINLTILKNNTDYDIPYHITEHDIKFKYLKERHSIRITKVPTTPRAGVINGLWANALGKGGILPIETHFYPCGTFLEMKLTGMQGDVMKESMTVAKTLAWSLLDLETTKSLAKEMDETKRQGIHVHVPEGGTPKDGPSGGTAITVALYSLLSKRRIKPDLAITGEICLQGKVLPIGGLDLKIIGGIRAGVKTFLFPKENNKDFKEFFDKYQNKSILKDIQFHEVDTIEQVLSMVFE